MERSPHFQPAPRLYLAAPYTAATPLGVEMNVAHAVKWWHKLTDAGYFVVCPHVNGHRLDVAQPRSSAFWYDWTLHLMLMCDAVVTIPDGPTKNADSVGTMNEVEVAKDNRMPVYDAATILFPYGRCPLCGAPGVSRERRPNGNDRCEGGHVYPSANAVAP